MPVAAWPGTLPGFLQGSVTETAANQLLRSSMDVGPAKVRRRTTQAAGKLEGTVFCNPSQRATFDSFFETTLLDGSLPFTLTNPTNGGSMLCRFLEMPSTRTVHVGNGEKWSEIALTLEILP